MKISSLFKKTNSELKKLPEHGIITDNMLKAGDKLCFTLEYSEYWIDIKYKLNSNDNHSIVLLFEIKMEKNKTLKEFKNILIKLGIKTWNNYVKNSDYYLLKYFKFEKIRKINERISLENVKEDDKISDYFDYNSKLKCRLGFINVNHEISEREYQKEYISYYLKFRKSLSQKQMKLYVKNYVNCASKYSNINIFS